MTLKNSTDFFHEVHDPLEKFFKKGVFSLHNLLWQLIVNDKFKDKIIVLHPVYRNDGLELTIVCHNESGYLPTDVAFNDDVRYDDACEIADKLNQDLFGIMPLLSSVIVMKSMRQDKRIVREEDCEFENGNVYVKGDLYATEPEFWQDRDDGKFEYIEHRYVKGKK